MPASLIPFIAIKRTCRRISQLTTTTKCYTVTTPTSRTVGLAESLTIAPASTSLAVTECKGVSCTYRDSLTRRERTVCGRGVGGVLECDGRGCLAQQTSSSAISGLVRDSSGGILPGVTVEVTSPSLIEKVRTATTTNRVLQNCGPAVGTYRYICTHRFGTIGREGHRVAAQPPATVNADMTVGTSPKPSW
jgi:hypothetical protein